MAARIGDWYAFSRSRFCRTLTVYDHMAWTDDESSMGRVLAEAAMAVAAPLGGPIAVIPTGVLPSSLSPGFGDTVDFTDVPLRDIPARIGADDLSSTFVDIFNNAGVCLACCVVPVKSSGEVVLLSWTKEEDLCVVTANQLCLFYNLSQRETVGPPTRQDHCHHHASAATPPRLRPARAVSLLSETSVSPNCFAATPTDGASAIPVARPGRTTVSLAVATAEGVVTLDHQGMLRGVLHGDRQTVTPLPAAHLPMTRCEQATEELHHGRKVTRRPVVTALAFIAPDRHDGGATWLLWSTALQRRSQGEEPHKSEEANPQSFVHVASWDDLVKARLALDTATDDDDEAAGSDLDPELSDEEDGLGEADLNPGDDDEAAARRRRKREKERKRRLLKKKKRLAKKKRRKMRAAMLSMAIAGDGMATGLAAGVLSPEKVATAKVRGAVVALEVCPYDASRVAVLTTTGLLSILASDLSRVVFSMDTRTRLNNYDLDPAAAAAAATSNESAETPAASFFLHKLAWCGRRYVLLHLSHAEGPSKAEDGEGGGGSLSPFLGSVQPQQVQPYTLLLPLRQQSAVPGERLDWAYDGSDALVVVAEVDGCRVVTDGGCYFLHEVPAALAALCKLRAPFHPAREYLAAYESYARGKREGFVLVRACLAKHRARCEEIFLCLLEAACSEADWEQQLLLLSAASFVLDTTSCTAGGAERMTDAVTRLRLLDALRRGTDAAVAAEEGEGGTGYPAESEAAGDAPQQPSALMPLTIGQYAVLGGIYQVHDDAVDSDEEDGGEGDAGMQERELSASFLVASQPITPSEGQVIVDRLLGREAYQLALQVCRAYGGAKVARVLSEWACRTVRLLPCVDASPTSQGNAAEEERVVRSVREVFAQYPNEASFMDCAATALASGRPELAFRLLRDEPPSSRKVLMLAQMGRTLEAMRAATESGDADLLYLALNAVLASGGEREGSAGSLTPAAATTLLSFPDAVCCFANAAVVRPAWRQALVTILLDCTPSSCRWWFTSWLGFQQLRSGLRGQSEGEVQDLYTATETRERGKVPHRDEEEEAACHSAADDSLVLGSDEAAAAVADEPVSSFPLPTLYVPKPPLSATLLCFSEGDKQAVRRTFGQAEALGKQPHALPPSLKEDTTGSARGGGARAALMKSVWGLDRIEEEERRRSAEHTQMLRDTFGSDAVPASVSFGRKIDLGPFSALSPSAISPTEVLEALQRQQRLEQFQQQLAQTHGDPRFVTTAVSVVDTIGLLAEHEAWSDAAALRSAFPMDGRKFFFAKLLALCRRGRWDVVSRVLGRPPPLVPEKRSFFSSGRSDSSSNGGGGPHQPPPPGVYEAVVETLLSYKQHELAAEYVPGITTDPATRVDWYVNRIGAPVMALEAAYAGEDAGLIRQILQRVPQNARAQQVGATMLTELENEG